MWVKNITLSASLISLLMSAGTCWAQSSVQYRQFDGGMIDLVPSLYGGDGITLLSAPVHDHSAHFTGQALNELNQLSGTLAGLSSPSFNLSMSKVYEYDAISEEYVSVDQTRNPTVGSEFAPTIGKGRVGLGFAVTHREFSTINGSDLDNIVIDLTHLDVAAPGPTLCVAGPPDACHIFELDLVRLNVDIDFKETAYLAGISYGLTDNFDVSVLTSLIDGKMKVHSVAEIDPHETADNIPFDIHSFDPADGADLPVDAAQASHFGFGDTVIGLKKQFEGKWVPKDVSLALGTDIRLPTGKVSELQGLPKVGISPKFLGTVEWELAGMNVQSNLNASYSVNGNIQGGDIVRGVFGTSIEPGWKINERSIGISGGVSLYKSLTEPHLEDVADVITIDHDHEAHGHTSENTSLAATNRLQFDAAFGIQVPVMKESFLFYEARIPLDDAGLRANLTQTIGLQLPF